MAKILKIVSEYGELMHTETDSQSGVTYNLYAEPDNDTYAMSDVGLDVDEQNLLYERLRMGDVWAWADVTVEAVAVVAGVEQPGAGIDHLGGCCYRDTAEFIQPGGYWEDMKERALRRMTGSKVRETKHIRYLPMTGFVVQDNEMEIGEDGDDD